MNQTTTNELQCYLRKISMVRSSSRRLVVKKWSTSTSTNLSIRHLLMNFSATWERISMLRYAGHRLVSMKWATSTLTNLSTRQLQMNFIATLERSPLSETLVASWPQWYEQINLWTRQLLMNFSATWERSPWSEAQVAGWLLRNDPLPHQPTYQSDNY